MERITLLDTSVGSTNKGDEIIMQCVREELFDLLKKYYILSVPTHLCSFSALECMGALPDTASEVALSRYKFVCGTNLLSGNMLHRTNQWDINLFNVRPLVGSILVGVGGAGSADWYTKKLYQKVLSRDYVHSVRDMAAYELVTSLGLKCEYTGCVTMWKLTPDFCKDIPTGKHSKVIFTLTDYRKNIEKDKLLIDTIRKNYNHIYFWIQGVHDFEYLESITNSDDIEIIGPDIMEYSKVLETGEVDYIGTRLHAGIYAMRHRIRTIIIKCDERMNAMSVCIPNNVIDRVDIDELDLMIKQPIETRCQINWDAVQKWKGQFN